MPSIDSFCFSQPVLANCSRASPSLHFRQSREKCDVLTSNRSRKEFLGACISPKSFSVRPHWFEKVVVVLYNQAGLRSVQDQQIQTKGFIPIIDIGSFTRQDATSLQKEEIGASVLDACQRVGFFLIKGHHVPRKVIDTALDASVRFFELPMETKLRYLPEKQRVFYTGYIGGRGCPKYRNGPIKNVLDDMSLDSLGPRGLAAVAKDGDLRESYRINRYPQGLPANIFPSEADAPGFTHAMSDYYLHMEKLGAVLLRIIASGLGLAEDWFLSSFADHASALMNVRYFSTSDNYGSEQRQGSHTDPGIFTITLQDYHEGHRAAGLQVATVQDDWISVPNVPGTFVVNIGDLLMRWTNDRLLSSMHRIDCSDMAHDMHSLVFFQQPNPYAIIKSLDANTVPKYDEIVAKDYW
eukprot:CAMPEP_0184672024 /NCGR_PEP_ID=MMETSP0308-20130426/85854_1 /TAXON_ID=38269 /ORGANISM="Gloeochaete witrockiana, Strain SAG 46.84" /LENGTH=409 /DNA_ID=CAMNT_0027119271 /DNA_START=76 /DNA_END=1302 /DNA_ORIENTATION=-